MTTTLFCLHALGSSSAEFERLSELLAPAIEVRALDLPGFGGATTATGITVDEMVVTVERAIGRDGSLDWALLGHSMGGKIASIVASRTLDGSNGLFGLRAVVLLAASPLSPEPMDEERRETMISWAADGAISPSEADDFLSANVSAPLTDGVRAAALADVERSDAEAWSAWFRRGSREDWSAEFLPNPAPALILAGADDGDLGADAQRELTLPHWPAGELHVVEGAAHNLPWEQPEAVADLIADFWARRITGPVVPPDFARVIASPRVSARTRGILAVRALPDDASATPQILTPRQLATLRAVARLVVPQGDAAIDLALRVDGQLAAGTGDGWRPDGSPADAEAYRLALDLLEPVAGDEAALADALDAIRERRNSAPLPDSPASAPSSPDVPLSPADAPTTPALAPAALAAWLEDATVDLARQWVGHPATMAAMDYDGFANGGDGHGQQTLRLQGFQILGADEREAWEPGSPVTTGAAR